MPASDPDFLETKWSASCWPIETGGVALLGSPKAFERFHSTTLGRAAEKASFWRSLGLARSKARRVLHNVEEERIVQDFGKL